MNALQRDAIFEVSTSLRCREAGAPSRDVDWDFLIALGIDEQQLPAVAQLVEWKVFAVEPDEQARKGGDRLNRALALERFEDPAANVRVERAGAGFDGDSRKEDDGLVRTDVG